MTLRFPMMILLLIVVAMGASAEQRDEPPASADSLPLFQPRLAFVAGSAFFLKSFTGSYNVNVRVETRRPLPIVFGIHFTPELSIGAGQYVSDKSFGVLELEAGGSFTPDGGLRVPVAFAYRNPFGSKTPLLAGGSDRTQSYWQADSFSRRLFVCIGFGWTYSQVFWEIRRFHCTGETLPDDRYSGVDIHIGLFL